MGAVSYLSEMKANRAAATHMPDLWAHVQADHCG